MKSKKKIFRIAYCIVFVLIVTVFSLSTIPNTQIKKDVLAVNGNVNVNDNGGGNVTVDCGFVPNGMYCMYSVNEQKWISEHCPIGYGNSDFPENGIRACYMYVECDETVTSAYSNEKSKCESGRKREAMDMKGVECKVKEKLHYGETTTSCIYPKEKPKVEPEKTSDITCGDLLDDDDSLFSKIRNNILKPLRIIAPILLLVFTTMDFAKVVFSDNKDGMPKAWKNFLKRTIAVLIIFFSSNIVGIIYGFIQGVGFCWGDIFS